MMMASSTSTLRFLLVVLAVVAILVITDVHAQQQQASTTSSSNNNNQKEEDCPSNLVLIMADQWSYTPDHEQNQALTPNLDILRNQSVEVKFAYATFPACSPNRASMLTGRYPQSVGVATNRARHPLPVPGYARDGIDTTATLAHVLRGAGYKTAWVGKWHLGNGHWDTHRHAKAAGMDIIIDTDADMHNYKNFKHDNKLISEYQPTWHTDRALEILQSHKKSQQRNVNRGLCPQPIFLAVSYGPPHHWNGGCDAQYDLFEREPPTSYCAPYGKFRWGHSGGEGNHTTMAAAAPPSSDGEDLLDALMRGDVLPNLKRRQSNRLYDGDIPPASTRARRNTPEKIAKNSHFRRKLAGYYGLVETIDVEVGRMTRGMDAIWGSDYKNDAITVWTTDHGDMLGSHGFVGKHRPQDESSRVPLYMRGKSLPAGATFERAMAAVDLAPTLCAMLRLSWVPEWERMGLTHDFSPAADVLANVGTSQRQLQGRDLSTWIASANDVESPPPTSSSTPQERTSRVRAYLDRPLQAVYLMSEDDGIENIKGSSRGPIVWGRVDDTTSGSYAKTIKETIEHDDGEDDDGASLAKVVEVGAEEETPLPPPSPTTTTTTTFVERLAAWWRTLFPATSNDDGATAEENITPGNDDDEAKSAAAQQQQLPSSVAALMPDGASIVVKARHRQQPREERLQWRAGTDGVYKVVVTRESWPHAHAVYNMELDPDEMNPVFVYDDVKMSASTRARYQLPLNLLRTFAAARERAVMRNVNAKAAALTQAKSTGDERMMQEFEAVASEYAASRLLAFLVAEATTIGDTFVLEGPK